MLTSASVPRTAQTAAGVRTSMRALPLSRRVHALPKAVNTLVGLSPKSELDAEVGCVLEIVIDGLTDSDVGAAMTAGITAAAGLGRAGGVLRISAGNYGGKLGPYHFHLRQLAAGVEGKRA